MICLYLTSRNSSGHKSLWLAKVLHQGPEWSFATFLINYSSSADQALTLSASTTFTLLILSLLHGSIATTSGIPRITRIQKQEQVTPWLSLTANFTLSEEVMARTIWRMCIYLTQTHARTIHRSITRNCWTDVFRKSFSLDYDLCSIKNNFRTWLSLLKVNHSMGTK